MRVAARLSVTVRELKEKITVTEFLDWVAFLDWEDQRTTMDQHYIAQLTAVVRQHHVKSPNSVKPSDFILRLVTDSDLRRMKNSKSAWLMGTGVKKETN